MFVEVKMQPEDVSPLSHFEKGQWQLRSFYQPVGCFSTTFANSFPLCPLPRVFKSLTLRCSIGVLSGRNSGLMFAACASGGNAGEPNLWCILRVPLLQSGTEKGWGCQSHRKMRTKDKNGTLFKFCGLGFKMCRIVSRIRRCQ